MSITLATTQADLDARVAAARKTLMDGVNGLAPVGDLVTRVNNVARVEGEVAVYGLYLRQAQRAMEFQADLDLAREKALAAVNTYVLDAGPEDDWSGRGNDARRCRFEGMRNAARELRYV